MPGANPYRALMIKISDTKLLKLKSQILKL